MKIVFFSRLFYPHIGGVERHVMEISQILIQKGHDVTIITEKYTSGLKIKEEIGGIHVCRINSGKEDWFKKFRIWQELFRLQKIIARADIVHCHDVFFWYLPFKVLFPKKPVYTTFHGYETTYPPAQNAIAIRKMSEKLSCGNICVGDFIKKWYGTNPDFVTYGGINEGIFRPQPNILLKGEGKLNIAFIGRLDADTGLLLFRQVVNLLKNKKIGISFSLYGEGSLKKELEKIGKVHGFVTNVATKIAKYDIIFASSYLSILEALAQKKLIFATFSNPLKKDYLKMAPFANFIIIENDPEKMAEKVLFYLRHQNEADRLTDKGYAWAKEQTWGKVADLYLWLWKR
jgi:glycosyltransferase involved in cell wall biosynthesis